MNQSGSWVIDGKRSWALSRPPLVTLIALLQFARGFLVLFGAWAVWRNLPVSGDSDGHWQLIFVLTNGRGGSILLAPVLAGYALAMGWGLWFLHKWARRALMLTSALNGIFWTLTFVAGASMQGKLAASLSAPGYSHQAVWMLVYLDAMIFLCLGWGRNIPESFAQFD